MALDIERIQAVCFDVDGTLRDTDDQYVARLASWLKWVRFALPRRDAQKAARWLVMRSESPVNAVMGAADRLGIDGLVARIGKTLFRRRRKTAHEFEIIAGSQDCLQLLAGHFPLAVITTRGEETTEAFLAHYAIRGYFRCVASAQTCQRTKPHPDPVLWAAAQMGVAPEHCLMIGDTTVDILAGKAAGAQTVGVLSGFGEEDELLECGADLILARAADISEYLIRGEKS